MCSIFVGDNTVILSIFMYAIKYFVLIFNSLGHQFCSQCEWLMNVTSYSMLLIMLKINRYIWFFQVSVCLDKFVTQTGKYKHFLSIYILNSYSSNF